MKLKNPMVFTPYYTSYKILRGYRECFKGFYRRSYDFGLVGTKSRSFRIYLKWLK